MPYKVNEIMQYTETVYYDENGTEVARERNYDDHWYDSGEREELDEYEMYDVFPEDEG